uniref:Uncharacterized protein n=1 Tax=Arundo donax TaxID=35708 RepID=A0A0A8YZS6_ARUDO
MHVIRCLLQFAKLFNAVNFMLIGDK